MIFVFDLFVTQLLTEQSVLFNKILCKTIFDKFQEHVFVFINDKENGSGEAISQKKNLFQSLKTGNLLTKIKEKKALRTRLYQLKPAAVLSHRFYKTPGNIPFIICITNFESINNTPSKHFSAVAGILVTSHPLKQWLINKMKIPEMKIFVVPIVPGTMFQPVTLEQREIIKKETTGGYEYFLINHPASAGEHFINLLKSFSFFKKRLQSGMKLVVAGGLSSNNLAITELLSTYKYRDDIVFTGSHLSSEDKARIAASAYAVIHFANETHEWVLPQEALQCNVPVMICQPGHYPQQQQLFVYADVHNTDDMAHQLMQLYKDETYRNKMIANAQKHLSAFSADACAEKIMQCLLRITAA